MTATQAFGFSDSVGCITLFDNPKHYRGPTDDVDGILAFYNEDADWFDLKNAADVARLTASAVTVAPGTYNWVVATWAPVIDIEAAIDVDNDGTADVFTKAAESLTIDGQPVVHTSDMSQGPAETTHVLSANGGAVFHFQTPFIITDEDATDGTSYSVDLTFDPSRSLFACGSVDEIQNQCDNGNIRDGIGSSIYLPMLPITVVPHATDDAIVAETYRIDSGFVGAFVYVSLFTLASDATHGVFGATVITSPESIHNGNTFMGGNDPRVLFTTSAEDGSLTLNGGPDMGDVVSGLVRSTDSTITFGPGMSGSPPSTAAASFLGTHEL